MHSKDGLFLTITVIFLMCILAGCGQPSSIAPIPTSATTAIQTAVPNPYPPYTGTMVLNDPLKNNSKGYSWDETTLSTGSCGFSGGAYHVKATATGAIICNPEAKSLLLTNLTYELSLKAVEGNIEGIAFRFNQQNASGYAFFIDIQKQSYTLAILQGSSISKIISGLSTAIKIGLNQTNVLAVTANGGTINLYINRKLIGTANNSTYTQGQLGIFVAATDAEASNAMVWKS